MSEYWLEPVDFQTGDVLGASQLNALLTDLDVLSGLERRAECGYESSDYPVQTYQEYDTVGHADYGVVWRGWMVCNADFLKLKISQASATAVTVKIGTPGSMDTIVTGLGVNTYTVAIPVAHRTQWEMRCVEIVDENPIEDDKMVVVDYVYAYSTPRSAAGPAFTNDTVSSAADFNLITQGLRNLYANVRQPIIGVRGVQEDVPYTLSEHVGTSQLWHVYQRWWVDHRQSQQIAVNYVMTRPGKDEGYNLTFKARLRGYNGANEATLWEQTLTSAAGSTPYRKGPEVIDITQAVSDLGLTIGTIYKVQLELTLYYSDDPNHGGYDPNHKLEFRYWWQIDQDEIASWGETVRWEYGDPVSGSGGCSPQLDTMTDNLALLNNRRRWSNPIQREPMFQSDPIRNKWQWRYYHQRLWRWLAYRLFDEETDQDGEVTTGQPVLYYNNGKDKTWQSYNLSGEWGEDFILDLDSTPILPGMIFYAVGCRYAIQQPEP